MRNWQREIPRWAEPLLQPARYKGAHGGRAGGKDHFFCEQLIEDSLFYRGLLSVCIREVQKSLAQSVKRLIEFKLVQFQLGVADGFKVYEEKIKTPGDGIIIFQGMQDHTAESIKSLEGFHRGFWTEAQNASATSLKLLRPTFFRVDNSELHFAWNPRDKPDPDHPENSIDGLLRGSHPPPGSIVVQTNFEDNPFLPDGSAEEEAYDRQHRHAEDYAHIWRGAYMLRSERRVFRNWGVRDFVVIGEPIYRYGADFGFSVDPSVLVRCFVGRWLNDDLDSDIAIADEAGKCLFVDYEAWRIGCDIDYTPALFAGNCPYPETDHRFWRNPFNDPGIPDALKWAIVGDSARPETISYCKRRGFKIESAIKGPGSLEEGVEFLNSYFIVVHPRCKHTADELTFYSFKTDPKTEQVLPVLEDKKNHVIDALRYAVERIRRARKGFFGTTVRPPNKR